MFEFLIVIVPSLVLSFPYLLPDTLKPVAVLLAYETDSMNASSKMRVPSPSPPLPTKSHP